MSGGKPKMLKWLTSLRDRANRRSDMRIVWPICVETAGSLDEARKAFFLHISNDLSWTNHYTHDELVSFVGDLTTPDPPRTGVPTHERTQCQRLRDAAAWARR